VRPWEPLPRSIPRVLGKIRVSALVKRLATGGRHDNTSGQAIFPQGGSTITQQLVRGHFLQRQTSQENSYQQRVQGRALRGLDVRRGRHHRRGPDRV
jgi:hypothetical protein